jgi:hypothetical protein
MKDRWYGDRQVKLDRWYGASYTVGTVR